jgi:hypothetical protein
MIKECKAVFGVRIGRGDRNVKKKATSATNPT